MTQEELVRKHFVVIDTGEPGVQNVMCDIEGCGELFEPDVKFSWLYRHLVRDHRKMFENHSPRYQSKDWVAYKAGLKIAKWEDD